MKDWYVLFTGYENSLVTMKRLVKSVLPRGCGAYAPVVVKGHKDRPNRTHNQSLYPFYLFVCVTEESQLAILEKKMRALRIDGYLLRNPNGTPAKLTSDDIREIEIRNASREQNILTEKNGFSAGERVRAVSGPLKGYEGSVAYITNEYVYVSMVTTRKKLTIEVPFLYSDLEIIHG